MAIDGDKGSIPSSGATVRASVNYIAPMTVRPRYHANDSSRDVIEFDTRSVEISDGRVHPPSLDREGFALVAHGSRVTDFREAQAVQRTYAEEIKLLIGRLTGADAVAVTSPGLLRFGEKSPDSGRLNNSRPARFVHVDMDDKTALRFAEGAKPAQAPPLRRFAHFNIWRVISAPPQDVPLALCDARSLDASDLVEADAVFDEPGKPEWSFTGLVVRPNSRHRWHWFPDMRPDEAIVFKTNDSHAAAPHCVPHSAFDNPLCPADTPPRASIEARAVAFWWK